MQTGRPTSTSQRHHRLALSLFLGQCGIQLSTCRRVGPLLHHNVITGWHCHCFWGNVEYNCQHAGGQAHFYITTSSQASTVTVFGAMWNTTVNMQTGRQAHFYITTSSQASTVTVFGQCGIQLSTCRWVGPLLHHNVVTGWHCHCFWGNVEYNCQHAGG